MEHGCQFWGVENFTKIQESLLNLISLSKQTWFWKISFRHIWYAVHTRLNIWHQFLFCKNVVLLSNYIFSKIEINPPIGKWKVFKNPKQKTAITFGEECIYSFLWCLCNNEDRWRRSLLDPYWLTKSAEFQVKIIYSSVRKIILKTSIWLRNDIRFSLYVIGDGSVSSIKQR